MKRNLYFCEWSTCNSLTRFSNCLARNLVSFLPFLSQRQLLRNVQYVCLHTQSYSQVLSLHSRSQSLLNCILHTNHTCFSLSGPHQWLHLISPVYQDASSSLYQTRLYELPKLLGEVGSQCTEVLCYNLFCLRAHGEQSNALQAHPKSIYPKYTPFFFFSFWLGWRCTFMSSGHINMNRVLWIVANRIKKLQCKTPFVLSCKYETAKPKKLHIFITR